MASESRTARKLDLLQGNERNLEHELDLIRSAVALLAAGGAKRVTLVGMSMDERAVREAGFLVRGSGMVMRAEKEDVGWDVTIEACG
jgi:hypothetical protein